MHPLSLPLLTLTLATCVVGWMPPLKVFSLAVQAAVDTYPNNTQMWKWEYGPAIMFSAVWEASLGANITTFNPFANTLLDLYTSNASFPGYQALQGTYNWTDTAVGDIIGLFPIAYLARADYYNAIGVRERDPAADLALAVLVADKYVMGWKQRLPDAAQSYSRVVGWGTPPPSPNYVWADDQYMGLTLLARLSTHPGVQNAAQYIDAAAAMQLQYAKYLQDPMDGVMYHGYDYVSKNVSCCKWGRANGWIMMAHVETLLAMQAAYPSHPLRADVLALFRSHAAGMLALQSGEGRWHQVVDHSETFLETSVTAMMLWSFATGVLNGFLDPIDYGDPIERAYASLVSTINPSTGEVSGICSGCGVQLNVEAYEQHPTDYKDSQPGLGSVFRAILAYDAYSRS